MYFFLVLGSAHQNPWQDMGVDQKRSGKHEGWPAGKPQKMRFPDMGKNTLGNWPNEILVNPHIGLVSFGFLWDLMFYPFARVWEKILRGQAVQPKAAVWRLP